MENCLRMRHAFMVQQPATSTRLPIALPAGDLRDVYNISSPFLYGGETFWLGRTELRESEDAWSYFFRQEKGSWRIAEEYPAFHMQDPFFSFIGGTLIIGGVEVYPDKEKPDTLAYRTIFFRMEGKTSYPLAVGPSQMKDIRLLELPDTSVLVFTRPQGAVGGRGMIGHRILTSLDEMDVCTLSNFTLLEEQFSPEEWGGANQAFLLNNGLVGVLSHIACYGEGGERHYYATCFCFEVSTGRYSPMKMLACRESFTPGNSKRPDLQDVVFSGGIVRNEDGTADLYCGVGDAEAHRVVIADPFLDWELKGF